MNSPSRESHSSYALRRRAEESGFPAVAGFTLVEVLVAAGVLIIACGLILGLSATILRSWNTSLERFQLADTAGLVLDQLESDLNSLWLGDPDALVFWSKPEADASGLGIEQTMLRLIYQNNDGALQAVCYAVHFVDPAKPLDGENRTNGLYRQTISEEETLRLFFDGLEAASPAIFWSTASDYQASFWAAPVAFFNVSCGFYDPVTGDWQTVEEETKCYSADHSEAPVYIDVTLSLLTEEGRRLHSQQAVFGDQAGITTADILRQYSVAFTRRVWLISQP